MTAKVKHFGFVILSALLALGSCRDLALEPVFYALSQEQPLAEDRGFPDEVSVLRMVKINVAPDDYYLAAANRLYIRDIDVGEKWTVVDPPTTLSGALCNTLEVFGAQVYAGFFNGSSGAGYGLWKAPLALPLLWTQVTDTDVDDEQIVLLKGVGGQLFVSTRSGNVNALVYGDGTDFDPVGWSAAPQADIPITDAARDSGGNYWVLVGPSLYQSTVALPGSFAEYSGGPNAPVSPLAGATFGGLFVDGTTLYVSGGNGHLYSTPDGGGTWARTASAVLNDDDEPVPFTSFALPTADAGAVYVGTRGYGYYRIPGGDVTAELTRSRAYNISALYNGALNCMLFEGSLSPNALFVCTSRTGLWRGDYVSGSDWSWKQE